jgi:type I restriction enzyme S subunit
MVNTVHPEREAVEGKTSAEQLITENIDVWTTAIKKRGSQGRGSNKKIELYGIKKLRELILELAVRGLLVPQDSNDEAANVLLERVIVEKETIAAERRLRKEKQTYVAVERFELPESWSWAAIGEIAHIMGGKRVPKGYSLQDEQTSHAYIRVTDMKNMSVDIGGLKYISDDVYEQISRYIISKDDVYISIAGTIGSAGTIPSILDGMNLTENAAKAVFRNIDKTYLVYTISSKYIQDQFSEAVNQMAQPKLSLNSIKETSIAIPPKAEQLRIVAKVNELMALCDQLEEQTESSLTAHQTLVETLLNTLLTAAQTTGTKESNSQSNSNQESSFDQAWNRIAQYFDILFTTEHSIDQLKQTILQLAVMGKLVPQDPNDEPASVLLEKIAAEKEQLIKDKKIKRQKSLPPIGDDEKPFELPVGWEWVRFFDVNTVKAELVPAINFPDENQIAPDSIGKGTGLLIEDRTVGESGVKGPNNKFYTGQILYSKIRPSLNKVVIAPYDGLCSADMYPIICHSNKLFMLKYMLSELFLVQVRKAENRVKMPKLNLESLGLFLTVLPPEAEQPRIANRINEFMELCEVLKANIRDSQVTQLHLADAMAEQALV